MATRIWSVIRNRQFHSLLGNVVSAFFNLLSFSVLVRLLPAGDFGEWVLCVATFSMLDQLRTALLQSGLVRYYAGAAPEAAQRVAGSAWYIALLLTLVCLAAGLGAAALATGRLSPVWCAFLGWMGGLLLLSLPFNVAAWILQAEHRFHHIVQLRFMQNGVYLLLLCMLYLFGAVTLFDVLYCYAASLGIASIYSFARGWTKVRCMAFRSRAQMQELYAYGRFIVGSMAASSLLNNSDNFLIRTMINPAAVALYSVPQKFREVVEIILRSFVATAMPTLSTAVNRNDWPAVARTFCKYTGVVTLVILPFVAAMLLLVKPLIVILASRAYLPATGIVIISLCSVILFPADRFLGVTLDMINRPRINFYKNLLRLVVNVVFDLLFIWWFNGALWGVALASVICLLVGVVYGYVLLRRFVPFSVAQIWKEGWAECRALLGRLWQLLRKARREPFMRPS